MASGSGRTKGSGAAIRKDKVGKETVVEAPPPLNYEEFSITEQQMTAPLMERFLVWIVEQCHARGITADEDIRNAKLQGRQWLNDYFTGK